MVDNISEQNDNFAIQNNGFEFLLRDRLREFTQRNVYNEEIIIKFKGLKEEPIPPKLDLEDPYLLNLAILIIFACHKGSLLLKEGSMR